MDHPASVGHRSFAQNRGSVVVGVAHVADDRPLGRRRKAEKAHEDVPLHLSRGMVVEVIEPGLADGYHAGLLGQRFEGRPEVRRDLGCVVRVNADGGKYIRLFGGQLGSPLGGRQVSAGSDAYHGDDARVSRALHHGRQVVFEIFEVEVTVRVHKRRQHVRPTIAACGQSHHVRAARLDRA